MDAGSEVELIAQLLITASMAIVLVLGVAHLVFTFRGPKLTPRDAALQERMEQVSPVITSQTTMWRCWIGFNASHSLGVISFGLIYAYLALARPDVLLQSHFLLALGLVLIVAYLLLARAYWFSIPFTGAGLSLLCYMAAVVVAFTTGQG